LEQAVDDGLCSVELASPWRRMSAVDSPTDREGKRGQEADKLIVIDGAVALVTSANMTPPRDGGQPGVRRPDPRRTQPAAVRNHTFELHGQGELRRI
jgi:phosphatidylserine/phosphatidylglycerophosphate/cardiolipin synthase-like enzyme